MTIDANARCRRCSNDEWQQQRQSTDPCDKEYLRASHTHWCGRHQRNARGEVFSPQLAIPVPLLAIRLWVPTGWRGHDFPFSCQCCWRILDERRPLRLAGDAVLVAVAASVRVV